jgi:hypothetical protein
MMNKCPPKVEKWPKISSFSPIRPVSGHLPSLILAALFR